MEFLKWPLKLIAVLSILVWIPGCSETATIVVQIETDTYISSTDGSNHSEYTYLQVSQSSALEERAILKLPTGKSNESDHLTDCLNSELCSVFFMPLAILVKLLTSCSEAVLQPSNLTSAILQLDTVDGVSPASGTFQIQLLNKPWWHSVSWSKAHPFSSGGAWTTPGGDVDTMTTFNTSCNGLSSGSCGAGEVKFEMTSYFQNLISNPNSNHYGFLVSMTGPTSATQLHSIQSANTALRPRLVATYTGSCASSKPSQPKTFYLDGRSL